MTGLLLRTSLLLVLAAPAALAQTPDDGLPPPRPNQTPAPAPTEAPPPNPPAPTEAPPPAPTEAPTPRAADGAGRVRFKREQGTAEALKAHLEQTLAALKGDPAALGESLAALRPDEEALKAAFTEEGFKALAPRILESAPKLFAGQPAEIAARLGLKPEHSEVEVFTASTEDLLTMESGTDAAREFASGLRRTAQRLQPRFVWYCAVLRGKGPTDEPARLQIFLFHEEKFVLLGRVWRIEEE